MLDLTNPDVQQYLIDTITDVIKLGNIEYIKWDMNRQFSDVFGRTLGTRQGEYFHRYYLGLYNILQALCDRFPHVLFESCSSGGNRFDLGMFCYMPQCWTSDNTDPLDRIRIQTGTSYGYPQSVMTMHVSASPSFASLRVSSIEERFNVASFGLMGYEMDVTNLSSFDRAAVKNRSLFIRSTAGFYSSENFTASAIRSKRIPARGRWCRRTGRSPCSAALLTGSRQTAGRTGSLSQGLILKRCIALQLGSSF